MNNKHKILLASEDIITRQVKDIYLDIELGRGFNEIKKYKHDNVFDIGKQFKKERNENRNFAIYGAIDSITNDCSGIDINLKCWVDGATGLTDSFTISTKTTPITSPNFDNFNVFRKKRGKYYFYLDKNDPAFSVVLAKSFSEGKSVFIRVYVVDAATSKVQYIDKKIVYYSFTGEFIEYGSDAIDIFSRTTIQEIKNDFVFFYNRHWVKINMSLGNWDYYEGSENVLQTVNLNQITQTI